MIKSASACLSFLVIFATAFTMPTEAKHHSKAKCCPVKAADNTPAGHFAGKWTGTLSGNDPKVNAVLVLNNCGDKYCGTLLWSSEKSGTCKRSVSGSYDSKTHAAILKDVSILSKKPKKGAKFCLIKKYDLQLGSDSVTLSGTYESPECKDFGSLDLSKPKTAPKK